MTEETKYKIMKNIVTFLLFLFFLLALVSCTIHNPLQDQKEKADYHLRQAVYHYPKYGEDSIVYVPDTLIIPSDTISDTLVLNTIDTVEIQNERVRVKITRVVDTFYVEGECLTDTVFRTIEVPCPPALNVEDGKTNWWKISVLVALGLLLLFIIINLAKKLTGN